MAHLTGGPSPLLPPPHGTPTGIDYEHPDHIRLLTPIVAAAQERVGKLLAIGNDVVLDHGLGRRSERDELKKLAEAHGARWELLCFDADISTLRARCDRRFDRPGAVPISFGDLDHLAAEWERPSGEGETIVATD